jgi:uncharacterized protein (DUF4415 family)
MSARNTVKFKLDVKNPPKLTATQRKRLANLAAMPDSKIDYSDIPKPTGDVNWTRPGALISAENKRQITLRLDSDVLDFFKSTGTRYQSRINAVLREYVKAHRNATWRNLPASATLPPRRRLGNPRSQP